MKQTAIAFDRASVRAMDADGRMHVSRTHISKANVCPYYGREIPGYADLGLDPNKVYRLWRDPAELAAGAASFRNLPLMRRHVQVSADDPMKDDVVGSIGSDVEFAAPYLDASLCIWDAAAIAAVESGQLSELSCGYRYTADMTPGTTPDGEQYDGRMTNIIGNHLALVEVGRAGPDVVVADENPFHHKQEAPDMKKTKLGRALIAALSAVSPKIAQDSALPGLVGGAVKGEVDQPAVADKLSAMDPGVDREKLDEILDAIIGVQDNPEPQVVESAVGDEGGSSDEILAFLKSKGLAPDALEAVGGMLSKLSAPKGMDEDQVGEKVEEGVKTAMDSMRREFRELEKAKAAVRPTVGDVIGMDSAEQVYRFALDHLKVDHKGMPAEGLGKLYAVAADRKAAPAPRIAQDSAATRKAFPGLDRFNQ